jgi:hypothetical protein
VYFSKELKMESTAMVSKVSRRKDWMQKVLDAQNHRNPEELEAARLRIERARQHEVCARKCKAVKGLAVRSRAVAVEGLKQMAETKASEDYVAVQERYRAAQDFSRARQETKCRKLGKAKKCMRNSSLRERTSEHARSRSRSSSSAGSDCSREEILRQASDSEEEAMVEVAARVGASDVNAMALVAHEGIQSPRASLIHSVEGDDDDSNSSEASIARSSARSRVRAPIPMPPSQASAVESVLAQLRREPVDETECAAKFSLYEGYVAEVENMRNTLFQFHAESRPTLPPAIVADMDKHIQAVDSAESMQIPDRSREWFVFHMMRQAERNNLKMATTLDVFDKKLKFLAQNDQVECPVCLDPFDGEAKVAETLGCCHKVCKECWQNWNRVMRGRPFCPFCRHEEFLGAVAARASDPSVSDSDSDGF